MWKKLSETKWRQHPLNKFRGWLLFIIILNCIALLVLPMILWAIITGQYSELYLAVEGRPVLADIFGYAIGMVGGIVCLVAIWKRHRLTPEIYLLATLISLLVAIAIEAIWNDPDLSFLEYMLAYAIDAALFLIAPVLYLFLGGRPNVMFKRRVRISS